MFAKWFTRRRSAPPNENVGSSGARADDAENSAQRPSSIAAQTSWLVVRRPLIDRSGGIAGWDIQLSARAVARLSRPDTPRVLREAYWFALIQAAREATDAARRVLIGLPEEAVAEATLLDQLPARTIVRVGAVEARNLAERDAAWSSRIEARGLLLAAPAQAEITVPCAYRLVDGALPGAGNGWRPPAGERWVAMNLPTYDEVGKAVRNGVEFCCGNFVIAARRPESRNVAPIVVNAANILSAIIAGRSAREIAEQFKLDTALSHRLLQATRSAAFALNRPLESIQEAVMMLGARELYRWVSVILMSADSRSTIATALHETALTRGRLLELLAQASNRDDPAEQLFVMGTFSLLDLILAVPLEVALALAPVPASASEALIGETGPWWDYMRIALALERDDPATLEAASRALGIELNLAIELSRDARGWAADTAKRLRARQAEITEAPV